jgi:hypothetical protein
MGWNNRPHSSKSQANMRNQGRPPFPVLGCQRAQRAPRQGWRLGLGGVIGPGRVPHAAARGMWAWGPPCARVRPQRAPSAPLPRHTTEKPHPAAGPAAVRMRAVSGRVRPAAGRQRCPCQNPTPSAGRSRPGHSSSRQPHRLRGAASRRHHPCGGAAARHRAAPRAPPSLLARPTQRQRASGPRWNAECPVYRPHPPPPQAARRGCGHWRAGLRLQGLPHPQRAWSCNPLRPTGMAP